MTRPRLACIIWMKALGMLIILYGHVGAFLPGATLPPINTKQLGVAFFVFITGLTLARDTRRPLEMLVRRLFEIVLLAAALALFISVAGALVDGNIRKSNYLPLAAGANVLFDHFPANPTTWYVGTYIHLIAVAALIHGRWQPSWRDLAVLAIAEVGVRAWLLSIGLTFVPYMLFTNWLTVFCLGALWGQRDRTVRAGSSPLIALALVGTGYAILPRLQEAFPFYLPAHRGVGELVLVSAVVTLLYAAATLAAVQIFSLVGERVPRVVSWIADHTLLIFLGHMPVYYALRPVAADHLGKWLVPGLFAACLLIPAGASVAIRRVVDLQQVRERLLQRLELWRAGKMRSSGD